MNNVRDTANSAMTPTNHESWQAGDEHDFTIPPPPEHRFTAARPYDYSQSRHNRPRQNEESIDNLDSRVDQPVPAPSRQNTLVNAERLNVQRQTLETSHNNRLHAPPQTMRHAPEPLSLNRSKPDLEKTDSSDSMTTKDMATSSPDMEKDMTTFHLEEIKTIERVGSHENYYEKGGLRTEGDGEDHVGAHNKPGAKFWLAFLALSFLWTGSQVPVYMFGGIIPSIYADIGGVDRWIWMVLGNLLALAAVCPFVGSISDIIGRRLVAIGGSCFIILGMIVVSTAHTMNIVICGMTLAGVGAGSLELTALAGIGELCPTAKRGQYVGAMIFTIVPWCPSIMYAQLINAASNWRYVGLCCGLWSTVGLILVILFYNPPPRPNSDGYTKLMIAKRIDYVGGLLSILGVLLFLMGLQWGGYQYPWKSAHVLVPLFLGVFFMAAFCFWEKYGAQYPMVPGRLKRDPRILILTLVITFISGANFFALLFFYPTSSYNIWGNDPVQVGLRGLPIGFSILLGAVVCLVLLGATKGRIRLLLVFFSAVMTAGVGAMAVANTNNLYVVYGIVILAGIGVGGIVVPCSIITTIICPDDLIATITALTLSIRVLGGAIGYTIYYNIFYQKFVGYATQIVGIEAMAHELILLNKTLDTEMVTLAANAQYAVLQNITDGFQHTPNAYKIIIEATQVAFADAYRWVYYVSIAFGVVSFFCACCLGDISKYMDDHVAVVIH